MVGGQVIYKNIKQEGEGMNQIKLWTTQGSKLTKIFTGSVSIQCYEAVQPHTAIFWLAYQNVCKACH